MSVTLLVIGYIWYDRTVALLAVMGKVALNCSIVSSDG